MITIRQAGDQQETAVRLLYHDHPEQARWLNARRLLDGQQRGEMSLDGLLLAEQDGDAVGAVLYVPQPDGSAFVWPPSVAAANDADRVADALLQDVVQRLDAEKIWLAQCVLEPGDNAKRVILERNGFGHLADLRYLERVLSDSFSHEANSTLETVPFDESGNADRFASVLEQTYIDTKDCPGLNGTRSGRQALESHRHTGEFAPSRWTLYRDGERDVGVLLLADHPEQNAWEVVYMGVVPEARGMGYGRAMLVEGLQRARRADRSAMLLAVDDRNGYARKVYDDLGFVELGARAVHVRLRDGTSRRE